MLHCLQRFNAKPLFGISLARLLRSVMKRHCSGEGSSEPGFSSETKRTKETESPSTACHSPEREPGLEDGAPAKKEKTKKSREIDWSMYTRRRIALQLAYIGWNYNGFAIQDTPGDTIESKLFEVLETAKLVQDIKTARYFKCGRTDKGVSALGQVISLQVRSNVLEGPGVLTPEGCKAQDRKGVSDEELPYVEIFNRLLPSDIRVLSWLPVDEDFNARFSCRYRLYKYFFPIGGMDVDMLKSAAGMFLGSHDFRNFCKLDSAGNVTNFVRDSEILQVDLDPVDPNQPNGPCRMYVLTVKGRAFLWHQIRCMVAILFLVGHGLEKPQVVQQMLDAEKCPRKPQYGMASEIPLILFDSGYDGMSWVRNEDAEQRTLQRLQDIWSQQAVRLSMMSSILQTLQPPPSSTTSTADPLPPPPVPSSVPASLAIDGSFSRSDAVSPLKSLMTERVGGTYRPLLSRPSADPVEMRLARKKSKPKSESEQEI